MMAHCLAPGRLRILARRRLPAHHPAHQRSHHEAGVKQHANRREQCREHDLAGDRECHAKRVAEVCRALLRHQQYRQQLGQHEYRRRRPEQAHGPFGSPLGPDGKKLIRLHEIFGHGECVHREKRRRQHEKEKPQRRRHVGHQPAHEHRAMCDVEPRHGEEAEVHQVALAPPPVAFQLIDQVGRHLLVAARQIVGDPYRPAGAAHQRCFDEIVREDFAGERTTPRQASERAMAHEGRDANDGVVPPVMRLAQLPVVQSGSEERTVDAGRELLHPRVQRVAASGARRRLNDARVGVRFADAHQRRDACAAHHAVGIEHDHVAIRAAPAATEVRDVAALALDAMLAPAIENASEALERATQLEPRLRLRDPDVGVARVGQHEEIEALERTGARERFVSCPQSREHARHVLVGDGHDDGCARVVGNRRGGIGALRNRVLVAARIHDQEARDGGPESTRHPGEENREQDQDADLERLPAVIGQHHRHEVGGDIRLRKQQCEQEEPPPHAGRVPVTARIRRVRLHRWTAVGEPAFQPLPRHHGSATHRRRAHQAVAMAKVFRDHRAVRRARCAVGEREALVHGGERGIVPVRAPIGRVDRQQVMQGAQRVSRARIAAFGQPRAQIGAP